MKVFVCVSTHELQLRSSANTRVPSTGRQLQGHQNLRDYLSLCSFYSFEQEERKRHPRCRFQTSPQMLGRASGCKASSSARFRRCGGAKERRKREKHLLPQTLNSGSFTPILICLRLFQGSQIISTTKILLT